MNEIQILLEIEIEMEGAFRNWRNVKGISYNAFYSDLFSIAAIIKGNHTNCAQFANLNRLNWLFGRLGSQASGEGSGMLDVLHCVLIDSPEALNMMRVSTAYHSLSSSSISVSICSDTM